MSVSHISDSSPKMSLEKQWWRFQEPDAAIEPLNGMPCPRGARRPLQPDGHLCVFLFFFAVKLRTSTSARAWAASQPRDPSKTENHSRFKMDLQKADIISFTGSYHDYRKGIRAELGSMNKLPNKEGWGARKSFLFFFSPFARSSSRLGLITTDTLQIEK